MEYFSNQEINFNQKNIDHGSSLGPNMRKKNKNIFLTIKEIPRILNVLDRIDWLLSPIDRFIFLCAVENQKALFDPFMADWETKRINKILDIYGIDYFKNKKVLELGSGHGNIGAFFAELGADVLCLEGRIRNANFANLKYRKLERFKCTVFNLENDFSEFGRFDLILNFGLVYHLKNIDEHLKCCFKVSDEIVLESVVCDSTDPYDIFYSDEDIYIDNRALDGTGCRPSQFYIERIAKENGFEATCFYASDLNSGQFIYDWKFKNDKRLVNNYKLRRFWRIKKSEPQKYGLKSE
jgi:2-polyprenyl-3-methyl-5-hydroxy-6-metoxy-1,4-benzoquinol methylase